VGDFAVVVAAAVVVVAAAVEVGGAGRDVSVADLGAVELLCKYDVGGCVGTSGFVGACGGAAFVA